MHTRKRVNRRSVCSIKGDRLGIGNTRLGKKKALIGVSLQRDGGGLCEYYHTICFSYHGACICTKIKYLLHWAGSIACLGRLKMRLGIYLWHCALVFGYMHLCLCDNMWVFSSFVA